MIGERSLMRVEHAINCRSNSRSFVVQSSMLWSDVNHVEGKPDLCVCLIRAIPISKWHACGK